MTRKQSRMNKALVAHERRQEQKRERKLELRKFNTIEQALPAVPGWSDLCKKLGCVDR
jgi:hypothetical protein